MRQDSGSGISAKSFGLSWGCELPFSKSGSSHLNMRKANGWRGEVPSINGEDSLVLEIVGMSV